MAKPKPLHPIDQMARDLEAWGCEARGFREASGLSTLLIKQRTGWIVWCAVYLSVKDVWTREQVEHFGCTRYDATIARTLGDVQTALENRRYLTPEHKARFRAMAEMGRPTFTQDQVRRVMVAP